MAQFDVYANPSSHSSVHYPYLVDIQSEVLSGLGSRIVIPLGRSSAFAGETMKGLTPQISFDGEKLMLLTPQIASLPEKKLRKPVGSLAHFSEQIIAALDLAITGI